MTKDRRVIVAFFVSVVVNLALVSYIVGNHLATHRFNASADPSYALVVMSRSLPQERIEELMPGYLERIRKDVRPHYRKIRDSQTRWYRALTAQEVNREQLEHAIDDYWIIRHKAQSVADTVFVEMFVRLSEGERTELIRALRQARARYDEWRRSRMRREDPEQGETELIQRETNTPKTQTEDP